MFWADDDVSASGFAARLYESADALKHGQMPCRGDRRGGRHPFGSGEPFSIRYSRMPFLAGLLEFLVSTIGWRTLKDTVRPLRRQVIRGGDCVAAAPGLVYGWLGDHLPTARPAAVLIG